MSTLSPSIFTLYDALGDERHAITPAGPEGTNELLSVGYYIRNNSDWPDEIYTSFPTVTSRSTSIRIPTPCPSASAMIPT